MAIGGIVAEGRKRQGMTQEDVSTQVNYSREAIAKYETGNRTMPKELYPKITQSIDDPETYFDTWEETTGYVSIPYFDGEHVDRHPSSMLFMTKNETEEAFEHLKQVCWSKPANAFNEKDRENLIRSLLETLDASAAMVNTVAALCSEHDISMKSIFQSWHVSLKARKFKS